MPCRYEGDDWGGAVTRDYENSLRKQLDELTRLLCGLCTKLDKERFGMPDDVRIWWRQHQARDQARRKREQEAARKAKEVERKEKLKQYHKLKKELGL